MMNHEFEKSDSKKYFYVLLSILVAAALWIFVDEHDQRTVTKEFRDIPITYVDPYDSLSERGLMLVRGEGSGTSETIDLTLKGTRRLISSLTEEDITVTVDISGVDRTGKQSRDRTITYSENRFKNGIQVEKSSLPRVIVNISEFNRRTVDVRCEVIGNVADGYSAGEVQLSQTEVELRGLSEDIDPVSYVKVSFDIGKDAVETVSKELTFQYYDRNGNLIENGDIHATVSTIQARLPVYVTKELKLVVNYTEAPGARRANTNWGLTPETITVSGDASTLKNVNSIVLGEIDLLELVRNPNTSYEASYPIIIPDGCKNLSGVTRATLRVKFEDIATTEVYANTFDYANLPEGKTVRILTEELPVAFFGTQEDIDSLYSDDIRVVADLSDYTEASGTYSVPATIQVLDDSLDVGVFGTYQVQVRIQQATAGDEPVPEPVE